EHFIFIRHYYVRTAFTMKALASVWIVFVLVASLVLVGHLGAGVSAEAESASHAGAAQDQEGLRLERREDYARALARYQSGLRAAEASGQKKVMADNWLGIGRVYRMWSDLRNAMAACRTALRLSAELNDQKLRFQSLTRIGEIQTHQGQYREAAQRYEEA